MDAIPKTAKEWFFIVVFGIFAVAAGTQTVGSAVHGELWAAIYSIAIFLVLGAIIIAVFFSEQLRQWIGRLSPNWFAGAIATSLIIVALSPYVQEKRWPFSAWFPPSPSIEDMANAVANKVAGQISTPKPPPSADEIANMVVGKLPKQPGANEIAREVVAQMPQITNGPGPNAQIQQLTSALNAANKAREDLTQQLKTETAAQPKSPILGLDDSKRWQIFKIMQDAAADNQGQHIECQSVNSLPYDQNKLAIDLFSEFAEILSRAWPGGNFQGFKTPPHQPFGITFVLGGHSGTAFECASHLAGALQNIFQIPIVLRTDQASDNLAKCNNQCVEIRYGGER